ncbi:MAG: hypothetical protein GC200_01180 [Tepidisphaera sp.]|nr:hypothetical protein [Tepidisphaera sp.]
MHIDAPSILEGLDQAPAKASGPGWFSRLRSSARAKAAARWQRATATPQLRRRTMRVLWTLAGVAALGAGTGLYFALRPVPEPDYATADLDTVFNYTLLTDEFNKLPVEERLRLMGQLIQRLKGMSGSDSMLLAAFAAGIEGSARDQIQRNISVLVVDVWDKWAKDYPNIPPDQRGQFLDKTFVDFTKMMEALGGQPRDVSDEQRLAEVKRQSARDRAALKDGKGPPPEAMAGMFGMMKNTIGGYANPMQQARGSQMMRDMIRHFRGQDLSTGKPLGPG